MDFTIKTLSEKEADEINGDGIFREFFSDYEYYDKTWESIKRRFMDGWNRYK